ncbi:MAG: envelope biogenesis factor ElyC [Oceanospirillaceae bacterium]|nr:envelope biogenesis factor ElyC [Oceanospirillaceae bacterium]
MFIFKKLFAAILMPVPMVLIITVLGLLLLLFSQRQRLGKWLTTGGVLMLVLLSSTPIANLLITPLENHYPAYNLDKGSVKFVIVLGSGHTSDSRVAVTSQIGSASLARLMEGMRIYKANPDAKLIFSGWGGTDPVPNAEVVARVAIALGVPKTDIIKEPRAKDTHDEAEMNKSVVGDAPFALVTSAAHMPRAMALFQKQGLMPVAAPANYLVKNSPGQSPSVKFDAANLAKSESAIHEYLGLAWAKLRGQI